MGTASQPATLPPFSERRRRRRPGLGLLTHRFTTPVFILICLTRGSAMVRPQRGGSGGKVRSANETSIAEREEEAPRQKEVPQLVTYWGERGRGRGRICARAKHRRQAPKANSAPPPWTVPRRKERGVA